MDIGVYGIRLAGLRPRRVGEPAPPRDWPRWTFEQRTGPAHDAPGMTIDAGRARIGVPGTGELRVWLADRRIALDAPRPVATAAIEHPLLVPAAAAVAHWLGRAAVHAAAVVIDGAVWGLVGDNGAGKSTLAAELGRRGCVPFSDDLLVVEDGTAFAGPPFIDLRPDVAAGLPAVALGRIGHRERHRIAAAPDRLTAPLGGWIVLEQAPGPVRAVPLTPSERVRALGDRIGLPVPGAVLLALADVPVFALRRERPGAEDAECALGAVRTVRTTARP